jgi:hypothetical protein
MLRTIRKPFSDAFQTVHIRRYFSVTNLKNHGGNQGGQTSANKTDGLSLRRIAAMEKAQENKYFRELEMQQMQTLKMEPKTDEKPVEESTLEIDEMNAELADLKAELSKKLLQLADLNQKK